jgi:3-oxoadipate enol-lactonase
MREVADAYVAETFSDPHDPVIALVRDPLGAMDPISYVVSAQACFGADISGDLADVTPPTLVLWGERDAKTPRELSELIASTVPQGRLRTIPGAGHLSNVDCPELFARAVVDFVDEVLVAGPSPERDSDE